MPTTNEISTVMPSGIVRAAVVQAVPVLFDTAKSLQKLAELTANAAKQGAELVVFPEAFIGGYPKGNDFGVTVGIRTSDGREQFRRLFESAIGIPSPAADLIGSLAKEYKIHLVVGVIERDGGTLYCTATIFGPDGQLLGKHRKLMITPRKKKPRTSRPIILMAIRGARPIFRRKNAPMNRQKVMLPAPARS